VWGRILGWRLARLSRACEHAEMVKWSCSRWTQAAISFLFAIACAVFVFVRVNRTHFERYAREYPHDGQDGLSALMDACQAGTWMAAGAFVAMYVLQRAITKNRRSNSK
jgi:hypothetical protein